MPKKFTGLNTKAATAKAKKSALKDEREAQKQKELEDEYWKESDKHVLRKQQRKEIQERKKQQVADRKAEAKILLEQETQFIKKSTKTAPTKMTRAEISETAIHSTNTTKKDKIETHLDLPLEENINRVNTDVEQAHTITEAISLLSMKDKCDDIHPEKRLKAAYTAFEERRLAVLKETQPTLRLSQLKQIIFKEWQKSPENPLKA